MLSFNSIFVFSQKKKSLLLIDLGQLNGYVDFYVYRKCFCRLYIIHSAQSTVESTQSVK